MRSGGPGPTAARASTVFPLAAREWRRQPPDRDRRHSFEGFDIEEPYLELLEAGEARVLEPHCELQREAFGACERRLAGGVERERHQRDVDVAVMEPMSERARRPEPDVR